MAFGLGLSAPLAASADPASGSITATFTNADTDAPAQNVNVVLSSPDAPGLFRYPSSGYTGTFTESGLPFGTYTVHVSAGMNYQAADFEIVISSEEPDAIGAFEVHPWPIGTATVSGLVTDSASGAAITTEPVTVTLQDEDTGRSYGSVSVGPDGRYEFTGVDGGFLSVFFGVGFSGGYLQRSTYVEVADGENATHDVALIPRNAQITGFVEDENGDPVVGAYIWTYSTSDWTPPSTGLAQTQSDGSFTITGLGAGPYLVEVGGYSTAWTYDSAAVTLANAGTASVTLTVAPRVTGSILGMVADGDGNGVAGICYTAYDDADAASGIPASHGTPESGEFRLDDLDPGDYRLAFWDCDYGRDVSYATSFSGGAVSLGEAARYTVGAAVDYEGVIQTVEFGGRILGHVGLQTPDGEVPLPMGRGLVGTVYHEVGGVWEVFPNYSSFAGPGGPGDYWVSGLPAGEYKVAFVDTRFGPRSYATGYYEDATSLEAADTVTVTVGGETTDVDGVVSIPVPGSAASAVATSSLAPGDEGDLADDELTQGDEVEIGIDDDYAGEWVSVWGHSTPTPFGSWIQVNSDGSLEATVPASLPAGAHKLVVQDAEGEVIGWMDVSVAEDGTGDPDPSPSPSPSSSSGGTSTGSSSGGSAAAGAPTAPKPLTLAEVVAKFGADTEALLTTYLTDTGRSVPPDLADLIAAGTGDVDLSDFSAWLIWTGADSRVDVYGYSTPTYLGSFPVVAGQAQLSGLDLAALGEGEHHLLIVGQQSGQYQVGTFEVEAESAPTEVTPTPEPRADVATTTDAGFPWLWIVVVLAVLLVAGIAFGVFRSRRA